ncbi:hypothetical protein [Winogradskyella pulchriflava]|uniref:Lipoprotein n=1 Tax=Winogradskyella pulchriflava TaxID=1110688 RepID=A0ABV6QAK9_9FLAO
MKTRLFKLGFVLVAATLFFGCCDCEELKNEKLDCQKKNDEISKELKNANAVINESQYLDLLAYPKLENGNIVQEFVALDKTNMDIENIRRYDVFGDFSIKEDRLTVFIPVTDDKLKIEHYRDISTPDINALLIRISNSSDNDTKELPITKVIKKDFSIKSLNLDENELSKDKKIKIIILNENNSDISAHTAFYHNCLKTINKYSKSSCLMPKNDFIKPNEDGGDIITGG